MKQGSGRRETRARQLRAFSRPPVRIGIRAAAVALAGGAALALFISFTSATSSRPGDRLGGPGISTAAQSTKTPSSSALIRRAGLWPQLQGPLAALGDRLEKPGNERITLIGTLSRPVGASAITSSARLTLEFPGRLRLEEMNGTSTRVVGFDGTEAWASSGEIGRQDDDLVETFVYDSADYFFSARMRGLAIRYLGDRFRLDDETADDAAGPVFDVYEATDEIVIGKATRRQRKLYYFNSDSQMLERVRYKDVRPGTLPDVEVQITGWHRVNNQLVPGSIKRLENGEVVFHFAIAAAGITAGSNDGIFKP